MARDRSGEPAGTALCHARAGDKAVDTDHRTAQSRGRDGGPAIVEKAMNPSGISYAGYAIVTNIDFEKAEVRCKLTTRDGSISPPLKVVGAFTLENKAYSMPAIDEQVLVLLWDNSRSGVCLGAIYSQRDPTHADLQAEGVQGVVFSDGTRVFMDVANSELIVDSRAKVTVTADDEITATVDQCEISVTAAEIIAKKGTTQVKVAAKVSISTAAGSLFSILDNIMTQLQAEVHPTAVGPSGPPVNAPAYAAQQVLLGLVMEA